MTKYAIALLATLVCSQVASAQHVVNSYRVVNKPHKHRVVTRTVAPTYYAPTHYAPTHYAPAHYAPVQQNYTYSAPGVKVKTRVNKQGEVRVRETYQQPWGGKQTYRYKSNPVPARRNVRVVNPVVFYGY